MEVARGRGVARTGSRWGVVAWAGSRGSAMARWRSRGGTVVWWHGRGGGDEGEASVQQTAVTAKD